MPSSNQEPQGPQLHAVLHRPLHFGGRAGLQRLAQLGGAQEARQPGLVNGRRRVQGLGIARERHLDQRLVGEARLLALVETDLAGAAVQVAGADAPVLPEPVSEEGAQRMRGFVLGQGGLLRSPSMRRGRFDRCDGRGQTVGL